MVQKLKNNQKKNLFIKTFGCQMNEYDSERIEDILSNSGFERKNNMDNADCIVINTCHIREKSTDKISHDVGRIKKKFRNNLRMCGSSRRRDYIKKRKVCGCCNRPSIVPSNKSTRINS